MIYFFLLFFTSCTFLAEHPELIKDTEEVVEVIAEKELSHELYRNNPDIERCLRYEVPGK